MTSLDYYDKKPPCMVNYLRYYGMHFNNKMCEFAISKMYKKDKDGNKIYLEPVTKEIVDTLLHNYNITLKNNQLWDYIYVANMCKADFYGSSIKSEEHLAKYIKDVIDDPDAYDGLVFNRWYADMCRLGIAIPWYDML